MTVIFLSKSAYPQLKKHLDLIGQVIEIPASKSLYQGIKDHTDLHLHCTNSQLIISQEIAEYIQEPLKNHHIPFIVMKQRLGSKYPDTVALNAITMDNHFIHNQLFSAPELVDLIKKSNKNILNVKQGYTRCLALPLDSKTLLTSDKGIYDSISSHLSPKQSHNTRLAPSLDIHLINNGPVLLPPFDSGFFAGTAGVIDHTLYINGDLSSHPDAKFIRRLCKDLSITITDIPGHPLRDIGSILHFKGDPHL